MGERNSPVTARDDEFNGEGYARRSTNLVISDSCNRIGGIQKYRQNDFKFLNVNVYKYLDLLDTTEVFKNKDPA